jgi:hypothetical protein
MSVASAPGQIPPSTMRNPIELLVGGFIERVSPCRDCRSPPDNDRCRRRGMLGGYCDVAELLLDRCRALLVKPASIYAVGRAPGHEPTHLQHG